MKAGGLSGGLDISLRTGWSAGQQATLRHRPAPQ